MQKTGQILLFIASLLYPLLWYYGRDYGIFNLLAVIMCVLWFTRAHIQKIPQQKIISIILALFFALTLLFRQPQSMYWYPVLVNLLMFCIFTSSLFASQTIIERLARLQHPDLPAQGVRHTRKVTQIWCIFFLINGSIAALLAILQLHKWWALYTGIIAYILMGAIFSGEWLYRHLILKIPSNTPTSKNHTNNTN